MLAIFVLLGIGCDEKGGGKGGGSGSGEEVVWTCSPCITIESGIVGEVNPLMLEVNAGPGSFSQGTNGPSELDFTSEYQSVGIEMVRTHDFAGAMDMTVIWYDRSDPSNLDFDGSEATWNFEEGDVEYSYDSDAAFQAILDAGITPYLRIGDSDNDALYHDYDFSDAAKLSDYAQAVVGVVGHYYDNEDQWGQSFLSGYVEIWNEPNKPTFWDFETYGWDTFIALYDSIATNLQKEFPNMKIGGPGFAPRAAIDTEWQARVEQLVQHCKDENVPMHFLSWHQYADNPDDFITSADYFEGVLTDIGMTVTESHMTEWGNGVQDDNETIASTWNGAAQLAAVWMSLHQMDNVDLAIYYRGSELGKGEDVLRFGLFYEDDDGAKAISPFGQMWSLLHEFESYESLATASGDADVSPRLFYLVGSNVGDGRTAILMANASENDQEWMPEFPDVSCLTEESLTLKTVAESGSGTETLSAEGDYPISIPAFGLQLALLDCSIEN